MNESLRNYAAGKGVRLWQIAQRYGITDSALSRRLRKEFSLAEAKQFKQYADEIAAQRAKT